MEKFTLEEVAKEFKVSDDTIMRAIAKGHLNGLKVGRQWRFTREQLEAYEVKRTVSYLSKRKLKLAI